MKPARTDLITQYRAVLRRYEAEGNPRTDVQRRLIARLEREERDAQRLAAERHRKHGRKRK